MGAWFHAKLKRTSAVIPTVAATRSRSSMVSHISDKCELVLGGDLDDLDGVCGSGTMKIAETVMAARITASDQNVHGHHASAKTPADAPPRTPPPVGGDRRTRQWKKVRVRFFWCLSAFEFGGDFPFSWVNVPGAQAPKSANAIFFLGPGG